MRAIILVGGFGTRLRPLTATRPKQMLPIVDRPMIEHVCERLASHGINEVVLSLGYRPEVFTDAYPASVCGGVRLRYAVESEPLDTAGAIRFAAETAGFDQERFVVVNGDVITDLDIGALLDFHDDSGALATIHLTPVDDPSRYGVVPTDDGGRVLGFIEKPEPGTAPTNWINAGTYVCEPTVLRSIPAGRRVSVERETFPALVEEGRLYAYRSDAFWIDTGTPATYRQAQFELVERLGLPACDLTAEIADDALLDRSVVMKGARIGKGAVLRQSVVLPGAVIGDGAELVESVVGYGAEIGAGAELRHVMIGDDDRVEPESVVDASSCVSA